MSWSSASFSSRVAAIKSCQRFVPGPPFGQMQPLVHTYDLFRRICLPGNLLGHLIVFRPDPFRDIALHILDNLAPGIHVFEIDGRYNGNLVVALAPHVLAQQLRLALVALAGDVAPEGELSVQERFRGKTDSAIPAAEDL